MANFAPDRASPAGGPITWRNAAAADSFTNDGKTLLLVRNTSGGAITVTINDPNSPSPVGAQAFNADVQLSVPNTAGAVSVFRFPEHRFNNANGQVELTWGSTPGATLQWAAIALND